MWILIHLLLLAAEDIMEGQLFLPAIFELAVTGFIRTQKEDLLFRLLPGIFALLLARVSKEQIGYGDGWLLVALGFCLEKSELYQILYESIALCILTALLIKKKEMPFVPFLAVAYLTGGWR